ncbi:uncharacterized protein N7473_004910 [Penicillium subrubescens]|uniref:uncharacterized protein n=1 Tax=Penicillium subrubescens TaxID=1316194 RepID=UPI0025454AAC|nr:uncharacterized protein N7473_004910 [Penicillium subrubescens]KAJ5900840.1 hypothetical protein N7473_004910 [Penicillium subrubescens]
MSTLSTLSSLTRWTTNSPVSRGTFCLLIHGIHSFSATGSPSKNTQRLVWGTGRDIPHREESVGRLTCFYSVHGTDDATAAARVCASDVHYATASNGVSPRAYST